MEIDQNVVEQERIEGISIILKYTSMILLASLGLFYIIPNIRIAFPSLFQKYIFVILATLLIQIITTHYLIRKKSYIKNIIEIFFLLLISVSISYLTGGPQSPFFTINFVLLFESIIIDINTTNLSLIGANLIIVASEVIFILIHHAYYPFTLGMFVIDLFILTTITIESKKLITIVKGVNEKYNIEREKKEKFENINKQRDEFISITSHELRSPITALRGYLELLTLDEEYLKLPREILDAIQDIRNQSNTLGNFIEDILNTSRLDLNRLFVSKTDTNINLQIYKSVGKSILKATKKNITIIFKPKEEQCIVKTDPDKIANVISNLLDNSIEFSNPNSTVLISLYKKQGRYFIKIKDHGIGIPDQDKPHLFEKYYNFSNNQNHKGSGLGLYLSLNFMRLLGGDVIIKSKENKWTKAIIEI